MRWGRSASRPPAEAEGTHARVTAPDATTGNRAGRHRGAKSLGDLPQASVGAIGRGEGPTASEALLSEKEVEVQFGELLLSVGLSAEKQELMNQLPVNKKREMVLQQRAKLGGSADTVVASSLDALEALSRSSDVLASDLERELQTLEVQLRTRPLDFVKDFIQKRGLDVLVGVLERLGGAAAAASSSVGGCELTGAAALCVRCLKALLNNTHGLQGMAAHPRGAQVLAAACLSPARPPRLRALAADMLTAVCLVPPHGHSRVLDALETTANAVPRAHVPDVAGQADAPRRFEVLLAFLRERIDSQDDQFDALVDFQVSVTVLANALVNSPEAIETRVSLRGELCDLGLGAALDSLVTALAPAPPRSDAAEARDALARQAGIFREQMVADFELLAAGTASAADAESRSPLCDRSTSEQVFAAAAAAAADSPECAACVRRIARALLLVP
ncbi:hypothetical protein HK405_014056, partial [Cladochytrium tenue]